MRHKRRGRKLKSSASQRKALLRSLLRALLGGGKVRTTQARGKELLRITDEVVNLAKRGDLHARRQAVGIVGPGTEVRELFTTIAPRYQQRTGGYTRLVKMSPRRGDSAPMVIVQWVK